MSSSLINLREVRCRIPRSRSTIYSEIVKGLFPRPIKIGRGSYWLAQEIDALIHAYEAGATGGGLEVLCISLYRRRQGQ
jgi:prophage regulatory protein